jgi:hypothetical protein
MDAARRSQLIRQRSVPKASLIRMQKFIDTGDLKVNQIQVRYDDLPVIFNKFDNSQGELELLYDMDHSGDRELFENQYQVKAKFNELLHPVVDLPQPRNDSSSSNSSGSRNTTPRSHGSRVNIKLPVISLPTYDGETCKWLQYRDTFEALIVNNATLSNVQTFHYLIASLKNEARDLVKNLQLTNDNFITNSKIQ